MSNPYFFVHRTPGQSIQGHSAPPVNTILRFFFRLLYHQFAFTYDLVAALVSFNRWNDWVACAIPFIEGGRVLEIGHGPGHLQGKLLSKGLVAVGIDESAQMGRLARHNLTRGTLSPKGTDPSSRSHRIAYTQAHLTRGLSQQLPFADETFDTVVATFPAEYIYAPETLAEAYRVLTASGRFVILPGAVITGRGGVDRALALLFRLTGQTPPDLSEILHERTKAPFARAGFDLEVHEIEAKSSLVFIMLATKSQQDE